MASILIVDDSADDRKMIELMIRSYSGHRVITSANGRQALSLAPQADLILMDVMMDGINGIETFQELRKDPGIMDIPIIFMTAYPDSLKSKITDQALGAFDCLVKPIDKNHLFNRMNILLGVREARARFRQHRFSDADQLTLLLAAMEQSADGISVTDREGKWVMLNRAQAAIFGYTAEELFRLGIADIYDPESEARIHREIIPTLEKHDHWEGELTGRKKTGGAFPILLSLSTVKDNSGKFLGIMGFTKDITAIKKAYRDLEQAQEALVRAERLKALGEMVGGIAHEFNNLLAGILGNTQILLQVAKDPTFLKRLRTIERAAISGAEAVKRLQSFTMGQPGEKREMVGIKELVQEALMITRPRWRDLAHKKGISIEVESELNDIIPIECEEEKIKVAVINVVFNAIDALPQGGKIRARCWADPRYAYIEIADNGVGMTPETKERALEPYFTTQRPLKSGLGLSVAYGAVRKQGGDIEIASEAGKGTTVTIKLPLTPPLGPPSGGRGGADPAGKTAERRGSILIIDDDPDVLNILESIFSREEFSVTLSLDPRKGLEQARRGAFDLVIADLGMSGISGLEVSRQIKQTAPQTKTALITGWTPPAAKELADAKIDALWKKPFDVEKITAQVKKLLSF